MKKIYLNDLLREDFRGALTVLGWLWTRRHHGQVVFLDLADSTGKLTGGPHSVRSGLPAKQQDRLDQEAKRHISMQKRFENNPIVDPKSGFFKRGWFSGLESVAG